MITPRERVLAAMNGGIPDKVPFMCQLSIGHMLLALDESPAGFWHDPDTYAEGLVRLRALYGFDGILVSLHGHDPDWRTRVKKFWITEEGEEVLWANGDRTIYPLNELPRHQPAQDPAAPLLEEYPLDTLPDRLDYIPVSRGLHFALHLDHLFDVFQDLRVRTDGRYSIHGEVTSPLDYYLDIFGIDAGLMGMIDDPEKVEQILLHFARLVGDLAGRMCGTGVDAIKVSSPFAGAGFLSQDFYRRFVLPAETVVVSAIRSHGVHAYLHTCGAIGDRLELMFASGASGIECLDPPPLGNVELREAKTRTRHLGFIKGNLDSVNTLLNGSPEHIVADAQERLAIGREGGGFILSTACSVAPGVKPESLLLVRDVVERCG